jgi:acid phosphatase type 7
VKRLLVIALLVGSFLAPTEATARVVIAAAGDIATSGPGDSRTARLIKALDPKRVLTLGDNAYPDGTLQQFRRYYDPTWGTFKGRTHPSPGNHDYHTPGAAGYFAYFGARALAPNYTFVLGNWRVVSLNSAIHLPAAFRFLGRVLRSDGHRCELIYYHHPRWSSGRHGADRGIDALWDRAVRRGVDVVLNGHDHNYERFARLGANGKPRPNGTREFVVGTGGAPLRNIGPPIRGSQRRIEAWGVLRMTLGAHRYRWTFRNVSNRVLDSGRTRCHP